MIKGIIFDFDGVLFDSAQLHYEASRAILAELGLLLPWDIYQEKYFGLSDPTLFLEVLQDNGLPSGPQDVERLLIKKVAYYTQKTHANETLPALRGVGDFLAKASACIEHFAIFSNGSREEVSAVLSKLDGGTLRPYFKHVTTIDDVRQGKPAPEGYLKSAEKLGLAPDECLVIEDSLTGIKAAKAAGMRVVGLASTHPKSTLAPFVDYAANNYAEIAAWFFELRA